MEVVEQLKPNLAKAVVALIKECSRGIDKNMTVGAGMNAYKGMADKDVKAFVGQAMANNGLCLIPIKIDSKSELSRYEETTNYNNQPQTKMKTSVFTEVNTEYLLLHESGESQVLAGYGHGFDTQDKSAGKATTYAMKNVLLYLGLVATERIDDTDTHPSPVYDKEEPKKVAKKAPKEVKMLTQEQLDTAIASGIAGIEQVIRAVERGVSLTATAEQILILRNKASELGNTKTPAEPIEEVAPTVEEPKPAAEEKWLTAANLEKTLASDAKGIKSVLKAIASNKLKARDMDIDSLKEKLAELENVPA